MKGLLVVLLLLVASGVLGLLVTRALAGREIGTGPPRWWLSERVSGGRLVVELLPPGRSDEDPVPVALLDPERPDFESALEDARAEAVAQLMELNRPYDED